MSPQKRLLEYPLLYVTFFCITLISIFTLRSISPSLFPGYYFIIGGGIALFFVFRKVDFEIFLAFAKIAYIVSIALLFITFIIGNTTRGTIRWLPLGILSIQPSEIIRPFIFLYFTQLLYSMKPGFFNFVKLAIVAILPVLLIFIQPSLGVSVITFLGFIGIVISYGISKKSLLASFLVAVALGSAFWFVLRPYQKARIEAFLNPANDPSGAGYNSIQSMVSVGAGKLFGRGLGQGTQTQLLFLPEKHTDFIFAAISEEWGFIGASLTVGLLLFILFLIIKQSEASGKMRGSFNTGVFFVFIFEIIIHVGMNMGLLPVTGVPLPLISAGGSSLIGSYLMLAIVFSEG